MGHSDTTPFTNNQSSGTQHHSSESNWDTTPLITTQLGKKQTSDTQYYSLENNKWATASLTVIECRLGYQVSRKWGLT